MEGTVPYKAIILGVYPLTQPLHRPYIWQVPPIWVPGMAIEDIQCIHFDPSTGSSLVPFRNDPSQPPTLRLPCKVWAWSEHGMFCRKTSDICDMHSHCMAKETWQPCQIKLIPSSYRVGLVGGMSKDFCGEQGFTHPNIALEIRVLLLEGREGCEPYFRLVKYTFFF